MQTRGLGLLWRGALGDGACAKGAEYEACVQLICPSASASSYSPSTPVRSAVLGDYAVHEQQESRWRPGVGSVSWPVQCPPGSLLLYSCQHPGEVRVRKTPQHRPRPLLCSLSIHHHSIFQQVG
ncbi:hypothetical protein L1887_46118 [Cichorium endivia]|nr:hypothetical protein L1887_46118 [Cichorium endivia]